eukprot:gene5227-8839_t
MNLIGRDIYYDIHNHSSTVDKIFNYALNMAKGQSWNDCAEFCDKFGARQTGSKAVEDSIDFAVELMKKEGFDKVHTQKMKQKQWMRGKEYVHLTSPIKKNLNMLGIGGSVATPKNGVKSDVIVVKSFDEFKKIPEKDVKGKIVFFNAVFTTYGGTVQYRMQSADVASEKGAIAVVIRSIAPYSINSPHTGTLRYSGKVKKIPCAAITLEDADMIQRIHDRNETIKISMLMQPELIDREGRNAIGEITGYKFPNEIIVIGGHVDSWDVGQGAMDDADGIYVCFQAMRILKKLGIRPKRTIRIVWWNDEEFGGTGNKKYVEMIEHNILGHVLAFEADAGIFRPTGWGFTGVPRAKAIIQEIVNTFTSKIGVSQLRDGGNAVDIAPLVARGVPGMVIHIENQRYFYYHHTEGDMMNVISPKDMDLCSAAISAMMYVVADIDERLPRAPPVKKPIEVKSRCGQK